MASKSNVSGLDTGNVLPSDQLELALGFEEVLAGNTASSAASEDPEGTTPQGDPVTPVTKDPVEDSPEAVDSSVVRLDDFASDAVDVQQDEAAQAQYDTGQSIAEYDEVFGPPNPNETIPPMTQTSRGTQPQAGTYWGWNKAARDPNAAGSSSAMPNGDIEGRAARLAQDVESGTVYLGGTTAAASQDSNVNSLLNKTNALDGGRASNDPRKPRLTPLFAKVLTYVTEDALSQTVFGRNPDNEFENMDEVTDDQLLGEGAFSKADGNRRLGREIHRAHQRILNEQQQKPTDSYTDLTPEEEYLLGDMAKELYYYGMNRQYGENVFLNRTSPDNNTQGDQAMFEVTDTGASLLRQGNTLRKKFLPKEHVRPLKAPPIDGRLGGEIGRTVRNITARVHVKGDGVHAKELNEAMRNYSQVAHVVDPLRLKILLSTALVALSSPSNPYRSINFIGEDKMNDFIAREKIAEARNHRIIPDPQDSMDAIENDLAQSLYGICLDRKGANYLTFYLQGATGRIAVQQTNFDPTTKKAVRFVTRSATPTKIVKGSRFERALRQMYAQALVEDADALVPSAREKALQKNETLLYQKGVKLRTALEAISNEQVEKVADAIASGMSMQDPNFPQMPALALDPNTDADLIKEIEKQGDDGQAFIDGLVDFANYKDAMDAGRPYHTYFNAYIDGKTNGLAANGMQLGIEDIAYRTGVLRSGVSDFFLDENKDIRDVLDDTLQTLLAKEEFGRFSKDDFSELYDIAKFVYSNRGLNKTTSMTFGYGKNVEGFKKDIEEFIIKTMVDVNSSDPKVKAQAEEFKILVDAFETKVDDSKPDLLALMESSTGSYEDNKRIQEAQEEILYSARDQLVDAIHSHYDTALREVLGFETMMSRNVMRGVSFVHAVTNSLFTIDGPTGSKLNMGGMMTTGAQEGATQYRIFVNQKGKFNIWYGSGENSGLSNLALRPFKDKEGRVYQTVEHAYQTLKSGKFDEETYNKPWKEGVKIKGKFPVNKKISIGLMTKLIQASFDQNPDAMSALKETRGKEITHTQDDTIWKTEFPRILMEVRDSGSSFYQAKASPKAQVYGEEATSASPKFKTDPVTGNQTEEVGGTSWGAAIPIPVQSIDAATVARLASNKGGYWRNIKVRSQNPQQQPYVFPIYDAFKMDAASYDAVLHNVNKAWIDINFQWSYLKQAQLALERLSKSLNERFKNPNEPLIGNDRAMLDYLFSTYRSKSGRQILNFNNKLGEIMYPPPEDSFAAVRSFQRYMVSKGFKGFTREGTHETKHPLVIRPDTQLTVGDLKIFIEALKEHAGINDNLSSLIRDTEKKKSALKKKVMANLNSDNPDLRILQYYSH